MNPLGYVLLVGDKPGVERLSLKVRHSAVQAERLVEGNVEVGFNIAKARSGIHADIPAGPVIDGGRGHRRRTFDGHIGGHGMGRKQRGDRSSANSELIHEGIPQGHY